MILIYLFLMSIDTLGVNLEEALKRALENFSEIVIQRKNYNLKNIEYINSLFNFAPNLSAEGGYSNTETRLNTIIPGYPSPVLSSTKRGYTFTFSLSQKIFSPSSIYNLFNFYSLKENSELSLIEFKMKLTYELETKYFNVLRLKKVLKIYEKSLERAENYFQLAEEKFRNGLLSYFDYMNIKLELENLILNKRQAEKNFYDALYDFNYLLGNDGKILYVPKEVKLDSITVMDIEKVNFYAFEAEKWIKRNSAFSLIYNLFSFLPEVYFSLFYSYSDSTIKNLFKKPESSKGIYLSFSLRFWDYPFNLVKSKLKDEIERENLKRIYLLSTLNYEKSKKHLEIAKEALKLSEEKLKTSEVGYNIAVESFKLGKISSLELTKAEENLRVSEIDYITSYYNYKLAITFYLYLTGNLIY
ncbi:MAG: TolC family protein [Candidatus Hydrothermales bacterium]